MPTETEHEPDFEYDERKLAWVLANSAPATWLDTVCYGVIAVIAIAAMVGIAIGWR